MLDRLAEHDERLLRIALAVIAQPGDLAVARSVAQCGMTATIGLLADREAPLAKASRRDQWKHLVTSLEKLVSSAADIVEHSLIPGDPQWAEEPLAGVGKLHLAPPWCLWIKTRPQVDPSRIWNEALAVVGTAQHTGHGYEATLRIAADLSNKDIPIATIASPYPHTDDGLAEAAARTARRAYFGASVVIGAEPVTGPQAVDGAACQPEVYLTTTPAFVTKPGWAVRDFHSQLLAALTRASLVLETSAENHVLTHIEAALTLRRSVFALPGPALSPASSYPHRLIREGHARLITSAGDLINDLKDARPLDERSRS